MSYLSFLLITCHSPSWRLSYGLTRWDDLLPRYQCHQATPTNYVESPLTCHSFNGHLVRCSNEKLLQIRSLCGSVVIFNYLLRQAQHNLQPAPGVAISRASQLQLTIIAKGEPSTSLTWYYTLTSLTELV